MKLQEKQAMIERPSIVEKVSKFDQYVNASEQEKN